MMLNTPQSIFCGDDVFVERAKSRNFCQYPAQLYQPLPQIIKMENSHYIIKQSRADISNLNLKQDCVGDIGSYITVVLEAWVVKCINLGRKRSRAIGQLMKCVVKFSQNKIIRASGDL